MYRPHPATGGYSSPADCEIRGGVGDQSHLLRNGAFAGDRTRGRSALAKTGEEYQVKYRSVNDKKGDIKKSSFDMAVNNFPALETKVGWGAGSDVYVLRRGKHADVGVEVEVKQTLVTSRCFISPKEVHLHCDRKSPTRRPISVERHYRSILY